MCIFVAEINAFVLHMNPRHKFKPQISALCLLLLAVLFVACEADTLPFNLPPTLTVSEATNIYRKGATISGTYTKANENVGVETFGLLYATNSLLGDADTIFATPTEIATGSYTATLSGLTPSTTYYYATFATSGSSIAKSDISHFTTSANSAPRLGDLVISGLTASSCVLSTTVLDDGGSALTLRGFLYKKAPTDVSQLTIQDLQLNVADNSETFTAPLDGLEENTRYAVCAYAVSAAGICYGELKYVTTQQKLDRTFTITGNGKTVTFKMIKVEGGTFQMGSTFGDSNETPVHSVTLTKDYYIGETEVTQALWYTVMGYSPTSGEDQWSSYYGLGDDRPAYCISYEDCQSFLSALNSKLSSQLSFGEGFRFPTEAEWEFAAKGGTKSNNYTYAGSNTADDVAWYAANSSTTHPVKTKSANELALYDMSGNVWEWCYDSYSSYSNIAHTDPTGPTSGSYRVLRGGSWGSYAEYCRVTYRGNTAPIGRSYYFGFRLCLGAPIE